MLRNEFPRMIKQLLESNLQIKIQRSLKNANYRILSHIHQGTHSHSHSQLNYQQHLIQVLCRQQQVK